MRRIRITAGDVSLLAELNESETARRIWELLPIEGRANTWGDEIYFEIPLRMGSEPGARAEVEVGELGYWPVGHAFCIFFGPTPASTGNEPRAYSPVNVVGRILGDATRLRAVPDGAPVHVEREPSPVEHV
ncbi:MAG: cyclophilin-like fold protein [Anaerolineae bacterium]|nr:cyclophilin-like fold protein [Anaerolineae bacterium]